MPTASKRSPRAKVGSDSKAVSATNAVPPKLAKERSAHPGPPNTTRPRVAGVGRAIAIRRAELELKRISLAERAGLSYPYVSEIERGHKSPSSAALAALAAGLEMTPAELLMRAEQLMGSSVSLSDSTGDASKLAALVRHIVRDELTASGRRRPAAVEQMAETGAVTTIGTLREAVLVATRAMLENPEIDFDGEGDIPIRRNEVMLFVRVLEDPMSVLVFSPMLVGINESAALLERVNELNANVHFVRFCLTHGGVVADIELFADPFEPQLVVAACRALTQTAEVVGPELHAEYGGRLFFGDDQDPKPRPGAGGYL